MLPPFPRPYGLFGAGVDVAQNDQLGLGRCRCFDDGLREFDRPAAISGDLIPSDAGVRGNDGQFLRLRIRLQNAEIRDDPGRAAGRQSEPLPMIAAFAVSHGGDEGQPLHEAALRQRHGDEDAAAIGGDFRRTAASRQAHLGMVIGANDGRIEIGETIDLRAAEEARGYPASLEPVAEHFRHRDGEERGIAELSVADRERQHVGLGADGSALIDQRDIRRIRQPRHIAGC